MFSTKQGQISRYDISRHWCQWSLGITHIDPVQTWRNISCWFTEHRNFCQRVFISAVGRWPMVTRYPSLLDSPYPPPSLFRQFKQVSKTVVKLIQKPYYIFGFLWLTGGVVKMMNPDQCYNFLSILLMLNRAQKRQGISPILRWGEGVSPRSGPGAVKVQLCKPGTEIWRRAKPWKSQNQYW